MAAPIIATKVFPQAGDFEAVRAAERFLGLAGFSVGRTQAHEPRGILFGDFDIQKWRNLNAADRAALHGQMTGGREGPVRVDLFEGAPAEAVAVFSAAPAADAGGR